MCRGEPRPAAGSGGQNLDSRGTGEAGKPRQRSEGPFCPVAALSQRAPPHRPHPHLQGGDPRTLGGLARGGPGHRPHAPRPRLLGILRPCENPSFHPPREAFGPVTDRPDHADGPGAARSPARRRCAGGDVYHDPQRRRPGAVCDGAGREGTGAGKPRNPRTGLLPWVPWGGSRPSRATGICSMRRER